MRLGNMFKKAKVVYDKRGGSAAAKGDLQELKDIQAGGGTTSEKLKEAAEALKEPGAKGPRARKAAAHAWARVRSGAPGEGLPEEPTSPVCRRPPDPSRPRPLKPRLSRAALPAAARSSWRGRADERRLWSLLRA